MDTVGLGAFALGGISYSPDGKILAYSSNTRGVWQWEAKLDHNHPPLEAYVGQPRLLAYLPGGTELIVAYEGGALLRWDVASRQARSLRETVNYSLVIYGQQGEKAATLGEARKAGKAAQIRIAIARNGVNSTPANSITLRRFSASVG